MKTKLASALAAAAASIPLVPGAALAQGTVTGQGYAYGPWMMGWEGGFLGPVFMIAVIAGIVALIVVLVRGTGGQGYRSPSARSPLDILRERFARGEIDKAEYDERRKALGE